MTVTIADRRSVPEAVRLPDQLAFKAATTQAADLAGDALQIDEVKGIVTAIVSVTGVVDEVNDIIVPGAYRETLAKRRPKVCWAHSWEHPIGKVLYIEELMPGDARLPSTTRDGQPWPSEAGALVASMQFNLRTTEGRDAFEVVRFYSESGECEYSIGYNVPPGKSKDSKGIRLIKMLELYELSVVLFGAHTMTGTLSIKDAARAMHTKRAVVGSKKGLAAIDSSILSVKAKANPFVKEGDDEDSDDDAPEKVEPNVTDKPDLASDADTTLTADNCPCGDEVVFDTANGWQRIDGSRDHDDGTAHDDWLLPPNDERDADEQQGERDADDEQEAAASEGADADADEDEDDEGAGDGTPDFSDHVMVALYPDPAAREAIASHLSGPDETSDPDDLHVTLLYLGRISDAPAEQEIVDAVTRAVEGSPSLSGTIGGIGMFPAMEGDDKGAPTYAPVDVPGINLLHEQILSEVGSNASEHGFTPHMTLGYGIGLIDPVPPTPVEFTEVRVVYGNSERRVPLAGPSVKSASPIFFTDGDTPPDIEAKAGDLWFKTADAVMSKFGDDGQWEPVDATAIFADVVVKAEGGADRNRGGAEELRHYWTVGEGGLKIAWGTPGDFTRCVGLLSEHMDPERAKGYCANRHKEMTGMWPGDKDNQKGADVATESKMSGGAADTSGKSYPQLPGTYEERQQMLYEALRLQYADEVDDDGYPTVWIDIRSTWPERILYGVSRRGQDGCDYFMAPYSIDGDDVEFGQVNEVELAITPIIVGDGSEEQSAALADAFPLADEVMSVVNTLRLADSALEGKAGRVLSGANERGMREAILSLLNILTSAGMELGEDIRAAISKPRGEINRTTSGDERVDVDPAVDLGTTSPAGSTKSLKGGEMLTIDPDAHRALLESIEEMSKID